MYFLLLELFGLGEMPHLKKYKCASNDVHAYVRYRASILHKSSLIYIGQWMLHVHINIIHTVNKLEFPNLMMISFAAQEYM